MSVDHVRQVELYQEAASEADTTVSLLIDLDVGDHRTGAACVEKALDIAIAIDRASSPSPPRSAGLLGRRFHGKGAERNRISADTFAIAAEARAAMARHGLPTDIVTGGSTGTWDVDLALPEVTELQAGSYALMDIAYHRLGIDFERAMTVLATVISANHKDFVTIDAGFKAFATDRPFGPEPVHVETTYRWGGDEFGYLDTGKLKLGDKIELYPPHCDPTVNLYDRIYACRGNEIEAIWPVKSLSLSS